MTTQSSIEWYKSLNPDTRIWIKENSQIIVGMNWYQLGLFFNMREKIEIIHNKLIMENIL